MGSLAKCLKKHNIPKKDAKRYVDAAKVHLGNNATIQEAGELGVLDVMENAREYREDILKQIIRKSSKEDVKNILEDGGVSRQLREEEKSTGLASKLRKFVDNEMGDKPMNATSLLGVVNSERAKRAGVKPREVKFIGLETFLGERKKVTKGEVLQFIDDNSPKFIVREHGLDKKQAKTVGRLRRETEKLEKENEEVGKKIQTVTKTLTAIEKQAIRMRDENDELWQIIHLFDTGYWTRLSADAFKEKATLARQKAEGQTGEMQVPSVYGGLMNEYIEQHKTLKKLTSEFINNVGTIDSNKERVNSIVKNFGGKYEEADLILPGGHERSGYRERLLILDKNGEDSPTTSWNNLSEEEQLSIARAYINLRMAEEGHYFATKEEFDAMLEDPFYYLDQSEVSGWAEGEGIIPSQVEEFEGFLGDHFDSERNVMFWVRSTIRMISGKRFLFIEEIQSDAFQEARKLWKDRVKGLAEIKASKNKDIREQRIKIARLTKKAFDIYKAPETLPNDPRIQAINKELDPLKKQMAREKKKLVDKYAKEIGPTVPSDLAFRNRPAVVTGLKDFPAGYKVVKRGKEYAVTRERMAFDEQDGMPEMVEDVAGMGVTEEDAISDAVNFFNENEGQYAPLMPSPYRTSGEWLPIAIRRILYDAAKEGNIDGIAWTSGAQQVDRYSNQLRGKVNSIEWNRYGEEGDVVIDVVGKDGNVRNYSFDSDGISHQEYAVGTMGITRHISLSDVIGRKKAEEIGLSPADGGKWSGEDLTIGGEGMESFYDQMVVNAFNGEMKKLKIKVGKFKVNDEDVHGFAIPNTAMEKIADEGFASFQIRGVDSAGRENPLFRRTPRQIEMDESGGTKTVAYPQEELSYVKKNRILKQAKGELYKELGLNKGAAPAIENIKVYKGKLTGSQKMAQAFAKLMGKDLIFVENLDSNGLNTSADTMLVAIDSTSNSIQVMGHELWHSLTRESGKSGKLGDFLTKYSTDLRASVPTERIKQYFMYQIAAHRREGLLPEGFDEKYQNNKKFRDNFHDTMWNEYVADILGDAMTTSEFWSALSKKNPTLYERAVELVQGMLIRLQELIGGDLNMGFTKSPKDMANAVQLTADMIAEYHKKTEAGAFREEAMTLHQMRVDNVFANFQRRGKGEKKRQEEIRFKESPINLRRPDQMMNEPFGRQVPELDLEENPLDFIAKAKGAIMTNTPKNDMRRIAKLLSNPWHIARKFPKFMKILNIELNREEVKSSIFHYLTSSPVKKRQGQQHEFLKLSYKSAENVTKWLVYSDFKNHAFSNSDLKKGITPTEDMWGDTSDLPPLSPEERIAYWSYKRSMDNAWELKKNEAERMLFFPYRKKTWFKDLQDVVQNEGKGIVDVLEKLLPQEKTEFKKALREVEPHANTLYELRERWGKMKFYYPRVRNDGDFVVRAYKNKEDEEPVELKRAYTRFDAKTIENEFKRKYPNSFVKTSEEQPTSEDIYQDVSASALNEFVARAVKSVEEKGELSPEQASGLRDAVFGAIANDLKARGFPRHGIKRVDKYVKGFKVDGGQKIFAEYMSGLAGFVTKQKAAYEFYESLSDIDSKTEGKLFTYTKQYIEDMLRNTDKIDRLGARFRGAAFVYYLAANLKSATVNLTQNFVTGIPLLSRHMKNLGVKGNAEKEYMKAMNDIAFSRVSDTLTDEEKRMLNAAIDQGITLDQYVRDTLGKVKPTGHYWKDQLVHKSSFFFSGAEKFNRKAAFLAMYRVQKEALGLRPSKTYNKTAFMAARNFVYDTHYLIGKANLPEWARSGNMGAKLARTSYTFRSFTHNYLISMFDSLGSRADGKQPFDVLARSLAYLVVFGGASAFPFLDDLMEMIEKMVGIPYRSRMSKALKENSLGGEWMARMGSAGVPGLIGADLSGSLSIGMPSLNIDETVYGVYGGTATKLGKAFQAIGEGEIARAIEYGSPAAVENLLKAIRGSTEGLSTPSGNPIIGSDGKPMKYDAWERALKTAGYRPAREAVQMKRIWSENVAISHYTDRKKAINNRFMFATYATGDKKKKMLQRATELAVEFNKDIVKNKMGGKVSPITSESIIQSIKTKRKASRSERATMSKAPVKQNKTVNSIAKQLKKAGIMNDEPTIRKRIADLHGDMIDPVSRLLSRAVRAGMNVAIADTYRDEKRQRELFKKLGAGGAAPAGKSPHNHRLAIDIMLYDNKRKPLPHNDRAWDKLGKMGEDLGLRWGGAKDYISSRTGKPMNDKVHFEMAGWKELKEG